MRRPQLIEAWARGESGGVDERAAAGWQPELWRRLRSAVGVPSLAERLGAACAALEADPDLVELPPRLAIFGLTRLPVSHLRVLQALAAGRDVHLMLLHPSPALWSKGAAENRLLASWGRDVQGLQTLVRETLDDGLGGIATIHSRVARRLPAGARCSRRCRAIFTRIVSHPGRRCVRLRTTAAWKWPPRIAASGSTPATGAPVRWRCCARRSFTAWRTTPRSSRAT